MPNYIDLDQRAQQAGYADFVDCMDQLNKQQGETPGAIAHILGVTCPTIKNRCQEIGYKWRYLYPTRSTIKARVKELGYRNLSEMLEVRINRQNDTLKAVAIDLDMDRTSVARQAKKIGFVKWHPTHTVNLDLACQEIGYKDYRDYLNKRYIPTQFGFHRLAKELGMCPETLKNRAKEMGIKIKPRGGYWR